MIMNSKLRPRRMAAIVAVTGALSSASMLTCGSAAANPYDDLLRNIAGQASREGVLPFVAALRQSEEVLVIGERVARGNQSQLLKIKNKACKYNDIVVGGGAVYKTFFMGDSEEEREAILAQAQRLSEKPAALVALICKIN
jgi:hypothetical protein